MRLKLSAMLLLLKEMSGYLTFETFAAVLARFVRSRSVSHRVPRAFPLIVWALAWLSACRKSAIDYSSAFVVTSAEAVRTKSLRPGDTLREFSPTKLSAQQQVVLQKVAARIGAPTDCARTFASGAVTLINISPVCGREPHDDEFFKFWANLVVTPGGEITDSGYAVGWSLGTMCPSGRAAGGKPYYGHVWMLDGCARLHPEQPIERLTPGVITDFGVILPDAVRRGILQQCSRDAPSRADFEWQPSSAQVAELERQLPTYVASHSSAALPAPLTLYKRQYGGFGVGRDSLIYVNLWLPMREDTSSRWHRVPVEICDGGKAVFGVVYDVHSHRFVRIDFNGDV